MGYYSVELEKLEDLMLENGISKYRLAKLAGVNRITITRMFQDTNNHVTVKTLKSIADVFNLSPKDLIRK